MMEVKDVVKRAGKPLDRSRAIWKYCMDCAGESSKEVTLCNLVDCPLWPWRFGCKMGSPVFMARMERQRGVTPDEFNDAFAPADGPQGAISSAPMSPQTHTAKKVSKPMSPYWEPDKEN
jgi:hypothetical protein